MDRSTVRRSWSFGLSLALVALAACDGSGDAASERLSPAIRAPVPGDFCAAGERYLLRCATGHFGRYCTVSCARDGASSPDAHVTTPDAAGPPSADPCAAYRDCASCTAQSQCGWCGASGTCETGSSSGPSASSDATCGGGWAWRSSDCAASTPADGGAATMPSDAATVPGGTWACSRSAYMGAQYWTCGTGGRYRCDAAGTPQFDPCPAGCVARATGTDDVCAGTAPGDAGTTPSWSCARSAYMGAQFWTCSGDARYRCDAAGNVQREACPTRCVVSALGTDDRCQ